MYVLHLNAVMAWAEEVAVWCRHGLGRRISASPAAACKYHAVMAWAVKLHCGASWPGPKDHLHHPKLSKSDLGMASHASLVAVCHRAVLPRPARFALGCFASLWAVPAFLQSAKTCPLKVANLRPLSVASRHETRMYGEAAAAIMGKGANPLYV